MHFYCFFITHKQISTAYFNFLGVLNIRNKTVSYFENSKSTNGSFKEIKYDAFINKILENTSLFQRDEVIDNLNLDVIKKEIQERSIHSFIFEEDIKGKQSYKKVDFIYSEKNIECINIMITDVTELYIKEEQKNEELKKALKMATAASRTKTIFLNNMSHDIRTPMNAIIGMVDLSINEIDDKKAVLEYLNKINTSSKFLLSLVNNILEMSKIENDNFELHNDRIKHGEIIEMVRSNFEDLYENKGVKLIINDMFEHHGDIEADRLRVNQIISNILSNALKYTEMGNSVTIDLNSAITSKDIINITIRVTDTGKGMSKEFLEQIYEPFAQEENEVTKSTIGTGLGLSIVKRIVDAMGGTINIDSELGKGTIVTVNFKCRHLAPIKDMAEKFNIDDYSLENKHILLVDDQELNLEIAKKLLERKGMIVDDAYNGKEAVEAVQKNDYDAILMDIRMPIMDGIEATKRIREFNKDTYIFAMSANAFEEDIEISLASGMNHHIAKPITPKDLYKTLCEYIGEPIKK